jgi:transposase
MQRCDVLAAGVGDGIGKRHELTDAAWAVVAPLLPATPWWRGRPWADHRRVINGILWVWATGVPWRDAPEALRTVADAVRALCALDGEPDG